MSKAPWILALVGVGGAAVLLRTRRGQKASGLRGSLVSELVSHPGVFGAGAGLANGVIATVRAKPMSVTANLVTAGVIGVSEGMLSDKPENAVPIAILSALGAIAGMAPFTRWSPDHRALLEAQKVPSP